MHFGNIIKPPQARRNDRAEVRVRKLQCPYCHAITSINGSHYDAIKNAKCWQCGALMKNI